MTHIRTPANRYGQPAVLAVLAVSAALLAGCGGSSKPAYCSAVTNLESSIKALPNTDVLKNGVSALQTAFTKVQNDATAVVNNAKSDFPSETTALTSSVDALSTTVKQAAANPSPTLLLSVPAQVSALVSAANGFKSATSSKCG